MIQLIGFRSLNSALEFAENNNIAGYAWTRRVIYRSRPWFSVLIGDFPNEAEATAAISRLSPGLRELQPIVRQIESGQRLEPTGRL
jgi:septal ring-binding cell division protein DamX